MVDGPFGSNLPASLYTDTGIPVIRGSNLSLGKFRFCAENFVFVSHETAERLRRSLCHSLDIVFTKKGTLGQTGIIPPNGKFDTYLLSSNQMKLTVDRNIAEPLFVYYYVSSAESIEKIVRDSEVTGVPKTNITYLRELPITLPSLKEQQAIVHILDTLDDKIELNRRMNETLEAMARALFKAWFVDFEPVRAKLDGRWRRGQSLPGLPAHLYNIFPDRIVESELGEIPDGWMVKTIGDFVVIKRGGSPRPIQDFIRPSGLPWVKIADATSASSRFLFQTKEFIKEEGLKKTVFLKKGALILSNSATPGLPMFLELDACIHDGWLYFPEKKKINDLYLYQLFLEIREELIAQGNGSVFTNLKTDILRSQMIVVAPDAVLNVFNHFAQAQFVRLLAVNTESRTLVQLRDTLLPKLISGEIRVADAERIVGAAI